jgi:hypothetical protein
VSGCLNATRTAHAVGTSSAMAFTAEPWSRGEGPQFTRSEAEELHGSLRPEDTASCGRYFARVSGSSIGYVGGFRWSAPSAPARWSAYALSGPQLTSKVRLQRSRKTRPFLPEIPFQHSLGHLQWLSHSRTTTDCNLQTGAPIVELDKMIVVLCLPFVPN